MNAIQEASSFRRLIARLEERKAWEAAHPELAAAWTEALREDDARQRQRELDEARARTEANPALLARLGVPARTIAALEALRAVPALQQARQWESGEKTFLVLKGDPGTGKTVAAAWLLRRYLASRAGQAQPTGGQVREDALWVASSDLACLSSFSEQDREWLQRASWARFLVLDDFAAEAMHEHALARLERLVDVRYGNNLRTVFTTNADTTSLVDRAGARITDRFRECATVANCGSDSLRRQP